MAVNIRPLHDRVIVRRIEEGEQVRGGIIIRIPQKKNPRKAKLSPSATASTAKTAPARPSIEGRRPRPVREVQRL